LTHAAAVVATAILAAVILLQALLVAGLPLGHAAWGGEHRVLPTKLRVGSAVAIGMLAAGSAVALAGADLIAPGPIGPVRFAAWAFAALFALNTLGNLASRSQVERLVMTPLTALLVACFVTIGLGT
jgi:hypothetical protein